LLPGVTFTGVDFTIAEVRSVNVRGRVIIGSTGKPPRGAQVTIISRPGAVAAGVSQRSAAVLPDGSFDFSGVAPGSYEVAAIMNGPGNVRNLPDGTVQVFPGMSVLGPLTARVPIEVGSAAINDLTLVLQPGVSVSGRLIIDGVQRVERPANMRVDLRPEPPTVGPNFAPNGGPVGEDGAFTVTGVNPGMYRVTVNVLPEKSYLKAARMAGVDVLNSALRIDGAPSDPLEIHIGLNPGSFDAAVENEKQGTVLHVTVVLVPDPARRHRPDAYRMALTDASGRVHLEGITPGDYKAFAWEDVEVSAWQDPDFLRIYEDRGKSVRISEGGTAFLDLRVITTH
jgi:hypothetical protein